MPKPLNARLANSGLPISDNQAIKQEIENRIKENFEQNLGLDTLKQELADKDSLIAAKTEEIASMQATVAELQSQVDAIKAQSETEKAAKQQTLETLESLKADLIVTEKELGVSVAAKQALDDKIQSLETTLKQQETEKTNLSERLEKLEGLINLKGGIVNQDSQAKTGNLEIIGQGSPASQRFEKLVGQATVQRFVNSRTQTYEESRYNPDADKYWAENRKQISEGIGAILREQGYLKGNRITQDITLPGDIPSLAFQHLSSMIRTNSYADLILDQFARENVQLGIMPGQGAKNFAFPRYSQITRPTTKAARTLTVGTPINAGSQNITQKNAACEILELGLGADASNLAVGISSFVTAFSMENLENIVMANLGLDYQATKNLFLQEELFRSDVMLYNNKGLATATIGDVATGDDGTLTMDFLASVYTYMRIAQIPTTLDGCYYLVTHPKGIEQILKDKSDQERYVSAEQLDMVGEGLARNRAQYGGRVSGYKGKFAGFHIFEQNVFGVGGNGTAGAQNETINSVSTLTRTSLAFGIDPIGWATALPVEIRRDEFTDFNRQNRMIWYSHENSVSLDVKNTTATGETMRVVQLRTIDTAI